MSVSKKLLRALDARDGHCCSWHWAGACDTDTLVPQHRANKGMGGRTSLDRLSNLVWLCSEKNGEIESDPELADVARRRGIKISSHADPEAVPIRHAVHGPTHLTNDGRAVPISDPLFAELMAHYGQSRGVVA